MATQRLSRLHRRILQWLATDHQRSTGVIVSSHGELVHALQGDKGNISRSLRTLEARGWLMIGRSPGGKAQHLTLTTEGHKRAAEVVKKLLVRGSESRNKGLETWRWSLSRPSALVGKGVAGKHKDGAEEAAGRSKNMNGLVTHIFATLLF